MMIEPLTSDGPMCGNNFDVPDLGPNRMISSRTFSYFLMSSFSFPSKRILPHFRNMKKSYILKSHAINSGKKLFIIMYF